MEKDTNKLFIALPSPPIIAKVQQELIQRNEALTGIKWVPEANLHITVFFLGFVKIVHLPKVKEIMAKCLENKPVFTLHLSGITFEGGRPSHPSMIWARFERNVKFTELATKLGTHLSPLIDGPTKFPDPIPHITLARIKHQPAPQIDVEVQCDVPFKGYDLWKSISIDGQVKYEKL